jgi:hypothetical protein
MQFVTFHVHRSDADRKHADSDVAKFDPRHYVAMIDMMFDSAARFHPDMDPVVLTSASTDLSALRWAVRRKDGPAAPQSIMLDRTLAQLRHLEECDFDRPIVMLDSDILVFGSLETLFKEDFDVAVTWRDDETMPINNGIIFLNHRNPAAVRQFFRRYAEIYRQSYSSRADWYGDQMAMAALIGLHPAQYASRDTVDVEGCRVRLLPCSAYNAAPRKKPWHVLFPAVGRKVLHFKAGKKRLMRDYWLLHFSDAGVWKDPAELTRILFKVGR